MALPGAAVAQTFEFSGFGAYQHLKGTALGSLAERDPKDDDSKLTSGIGYGARLTWNTPGYYGHELGYSRTNATFRTRIRPADTTTETIRESDVIAQEIFYNFMMYFMPAGERWRPFATVGAQAYQWSRPRIPEWTGAGSRNYGANFGGGVKLKISEHALIRLDVRDYISGAPYRSGMTTAPANRKRLSHAEGSIGIGIAF